MPKAGYGQAKRLAEHLSVNTTLVSQVFKGLKSFTLEQAALAAEFAGLSRQEAEYFVLLVQLDRAGNEPLRKMLRGQLETMRANARELVNRLSAKRKLTEQERAQFYSDWIYSAIRQMTAIPGYDNVDAIARSLDLTLRETKEAVAFLLRIGLCVEHKGHLKIGPSSTHLESSSPWIKSSHRHWRDKARQYLGTEQESALHYTAPMTLSKRDAKKLRELITQFLERVDTIVEPSPSEELHCLTIDWFKVNK